MEKYFSTVSWETNDLLSCKQAYVILRREFSAEELLMLDFGNLDIDAVEDELNPQAEVDHDAIMEAISYYEGNTIRGLHFNADLNQYEGTIFVAYPSYLYDNECYGIVFEEEPVSYSLEYGRVVLWEYKRLLNFPEDYLPF